jgi:hypothetical protein
MQVVLLPATAASHSAAARHSAAAPAAAVAAPPPSPWRRSGTCRHVLFIGRKGTREPGLRALAPCTRKILEEGGGDIGVCGENLQEVAKSINRVANCF